MAAGASLGSPAEAFAQDVVLKIRQPGGSLRVPSDTACLSHQRWLANDVRITARLASDCRIAGPGKVPFTRGPAAFRVAPSATSTGHPQPPIPTDVAKEVPLLKPGSTLVSFIYPAQNKALVDALAARGMTVLGELRCWGGLGPGLPSNRSEKVGGGVCCCRYICQHIAALPAPAEPIIMQAWTASPAPSAAPRPLTPCPPWPTSLATGQLGGWGWGLRAVRCANTSCLTRTPGPHAFACPPVCLCSCH